MRCCFRPHGAGPFVCAARAIKRLGTVASVLTTFSAARGALGLAVRLVLVVRWLGRMFALMVIVARVHCMTHDNSLPCVVCL